MSVVAVRLNAEALRHSMDRACVELPKHGSALAALGYPMSWLVVCEGLQLRVVYESGLGRLRHAVETAMPTIADAARRTTRSIVWASFIRGPVMAAASGDLRHALTLPVHGPGSLMALVSVSGRVPIGRGAASQTLSVMRQVGFDALDDLAAVAERLGPTLTARQAETLRLLAEGMAQRDVARQLGISLTAVGYLVSRAMDRLGASNQTEAVARAMLTGQIQSVVRWGARAR
ncbi:response regulator transcription factor [Panacagrimonas sp.]|uniref:helix-turn-helix transcriptional regulator n=1 Tax=Panacagrimonas sp. TaxID=2480088 RepID=UPI003B525238